MPTKFLATAVASSMLALVVACASSPQQTVAVSQPAPLPPIGPSGQVPDAMLAATVRSNAPTRYVVRKGDTLWDIANYFFRDPWLWPEIWQINRYIKNPHLIYPGDILELDWVNGRPILRLGAGSSRLQPRVRTTPLGDAIPAIPPELIRPFLRGPRLVDETELESAPYLLATVDEHLLAAENDLVYVRRLGPRPLGAWDVVRRGEAYVDPDTNETLGIEAIFIGNARLDREGDPGVALMTDTVREGRAGDRFLPPAEELMNLRLVPRAPDVPIAGQIISVYEGVFNIAQYEIVTINRGKRDGLLPGHVLAVDRRGARIEDPWANSRDPATTEFKTVRTRSNVGRVTGEVGHEYVTLPDEQAGVLLVFYSYERFSYGLIMSARRPMRVFDKVRNP